MTPIMAGAFMLSATFGFYAFFQPQKNPQAPKPTIPFDFGTPDSYKFYLQAGNIANLDKLYLKGSNWPSTTRQTQYLRQLLAGARPFAAHEERALRGAGGGGWYDAEDLSGPYRTFYPSTSSTRRRRPTLVEGPWVHGGWARSDGSHLGDVQFNSKTGELLPRQRAVSRSSSSI